MATPSSARTPGSSLRPGGRSAAVRRAVLEACSVLLTEGDLTSVTVANIAVRSGIHESSIYRRWGTVEEVIVDTLLDAVEESSPAPDTGSLHSDLVALLSSLESFLATPMGRVAFQLGVAPRTSSEMRIRDLYLHERVGWISDILQRAGRRGELPRHLDATSFVELLVGPTYVRAAFGVSSSLSVDDRVALAIEFARKRPPPRRRRLRGPDRRSSS